MTVGGEVGARGQVTKTIKHLAHNYWQSLYSDYSGTTPDKAVLDVGQADLEWWGGDGRILLRISCMISSSRNDSSVLGMCVFTRWTAQQNLFLDDVRKEFFFFLTPIS